MIFHMNYHREEFKLVENGKQEEINELIFVESFELYFIKIFSLSISSSTFLSHHHQSCGLVERVLKSEVQTLKLLEMTLDYPFRK